ncbi:Nucleotide-binding, alpha-beta plait [Ophiocordyceps camponoti-floridani]|uniref:Nucleotide-binding, alpha-beta plait n=1 Tax=Ophiocordyceps camponoti-floridani TaxID=2030778 RepID=A0A8H4Q8H2_9HYPO|nr:Nucleotide-binding, alpha-beta plait [Ophiocordyceps camponoti-floridani]
MTAGWPPMTPPPTVSPHSSETASWEMSPSMEAPWPLPDPFHFVEVPSLVDIRQAGPDHDLNMRFPPLQPHAEDKPDFDLMEYDQLDSDSPDSIQANSEMTDEDFGSLEYHEDTVNLAWPRLFHSPSPDLSSSPPSRRVLMLNLPPSAVTAQLLSGICNNHTVLRASIVPDLRHLRLTRTGHVVFNTAADAAKFVRHVRHQPVSFVGDDGEVYEAEAWLVPTPSWPCARDGYWREKGCTRVMEVDSVDVDAVWRLISVSGIQHVSRVWYDEDRGVLTIEMASVVEAVHAQEAIRLTLGRSPWYTVRFEDSGCLHHGGDEEEDDDDSYGHIEKDDDQDDDLIIGHIPADHLEKKWNKAPYIPRPETPRYRRAWSWSITREDDIKLSLMAFTLHDPDWAEEWDLHFEAEGTPHLGKWERYGWLARHRREKAVEQGLEEWQVPECGDDCPWKCGQLSRAAVPAVIKDYLAGKAKRDDSDSEME